MKNLIGLVLLATLVLSVQAEDYNSPRVKKLYKECAGCHGKDGKNRAFGKSDIIAGQSVSELVRKIISYKYNDFEGRGVKEVMNKQAKKLAKEDIKLLAEYISRPQ